MTQIVVVQLTLSVVFLAAGFGKLLSSASLVDDIMAYRLLSAGQRQLVARFLPWMELGLGFLCLSGILLSVSAVLMIVMLLAFTIAAAVTLRRHQRIPCHCFGLGTTPMGPLTIVRNLLLIAAAAFLFWQTRTALPSGAIGTEWSSGLSTLRDGTTALLVAGSVAMSVLILYVLSEVDSTLLRFR